METSPENLKKIRYWIELPLEIGKCVINELLLELDMMTTPKPTGKPANIQHYRSEIPDIAA